MPFISNNSFGLFTWKSARISKFYWSSCWFYSFSFFSWIWRSCMFVFL